jgi:release factor glutamine methyltransferase
MQAKTPDLSHLSSETLKYVYEPSDDTYLFLDALLGDERFIAENVQPKICVEIG